MHQYRYVVEFTDALISSQILHRNTEYVNAVEAAQVKTISNDLLVPHGVEF